MNPNYQTDAEHSGLRPAGPHLIERSSDSPAQSVSRGQVTVNKSYTVVVVATIPAIRVKPQSGSVS